MSSLNFSPGNALGSIQGYIDPQKRKSVHQCRRGTSERFGLGPDGIRRLAHATPSEDAIFTARLVMVERYPDDFGDEDAVREYLMACEESDPLYQEYQRIRLQLLGEIQ